MNYFDKIIILIMISTFSTVIYYISVSYLKDLHNEQKEILNSLANITTLYLIIKYSVLFNNELFLLSFIPIIISYDKKNIKDAIIMSLLLWIYSYFCYDQFILISIIMISLYLINKFIKNKSLLYLLCLSIPLFGITNYNKYTLINIVTYIIVLLADKAILNISEDIVLCHNNYKKLLKEEQITTSLFKITHEIKNPLAVCIGYLNMLDNADLDKYKKYTKIIKSEIDRSLLILQDFSNLSKITINKDIMDTNMLLEEVVDKISILAHQKNIKINFDYDEELFIDGDYDRLGQVFINIIKNSIEAIPNNGLIQINSYLNNNNIYIEISDNGEGIPTDILNKINEPFFTTKKNGTGLGVPLSKEIIKKHNGTIRYNSIYNQGTTVVICIPAI